MPTKANRRSTKSGLPKPTATKTTRTRLTARERTLPAAARGLFEKFESRTATIGIVGLGYVGLPLARAMHTAGYRVVGYDIDPKKIAQLRQGKGYLKHLGQELFTELAKSARFTPTDKPSALAACDAIAICVPTPLDAHQQPDLSYVENSARMIATVMDAAKPRKKPVLVSLESTTYPGTTREIVLPILESAKRTLGRDLFVVFSPEREDPGRQGVDTATIPRLVGGLDAASTHLGAAFYSAAIEEVIPVDTAEIAESAKLLENIYRCVNIALVNELKPVLADMGIDIWKVIRAASTKPFGFAPFYPGPGLGGHCIPIDPFYLTYKAKEYGHNTRFIELAGEVNHKMPAYVVEQTAAALNRRSKPVQNARILLLGIAYKANIDDIRETPAAEVLELLLKQGAKVTYHDPHVAVFHKGRKHKHEMRSVPLTAATLEATDAVIILTDHTAVDYALLGKHAPLIIDTRDAMRAISNPRATVVKA